MALNIDKNFKPSLDTTRRRGRSNPRSSFVKILAAPPPTPAESRKTLYNLEEEEEEIFMAREEKMGLLDIDLNVLPQDDSPTAKKGVNDQERRQTAVATVASNFGEMKVSCQSECGSNFNRIAEEVLDENEEDKERRGRHWKALLDVTEDALREYEENFRKKERKFETRKQSENRRTSREAELGGELLKGWTKKTTRDRRQTMGETRTYDLEVAAEVVVVAPPVVRSMRGRAVALPNKYRDSFLGPVAEGVFSRQKRSGKSATIVATNRKSR